MTHLALATRLLCSSVSLVTTVLYLRKRDKKQREEKALQDRLDRVIRGNS